MSSVIEALPIRPAGCAGLPHREQLRGSHGTLSRGRRVTQLAGDVMFAAATSCLCGNLMTFGHRSLMSSSATTPDDSRTRILAKKKAFTLCVQGIVISSSASPTLSNSSTTISLRHFFVPLSWPEVLLTRALPKHSVPDTPGSLGPHSYFLRAYRLLAYLNVRPFGRINEGFKEFGSMHLFEHSRSSSKRRKCNLVLDLERLEERCCLAVIISEFMSNNDNPPVGAPTGDWVELYNTGSTTVNFEFGNQQWYLSDGNPNNRKFLTGTLGSQQYRLVQLDQNWGLGRNERLDASHDDVQLFAWDNQAAQHVLHNKILNYPEQITDASYGVVPGTEELSSPKYKFFETPSPGAPNGYITNFGPSSGIYSLANPPVVSLASTVGSVRYTTNGSLPTATNGTSSPPQISNSTIVRASVLSATGTIIETSIRSYIIEEAIQPPIPTGQTATFVQAAKSLPSLFVTVMSDAPPTSPATNTFTSSFSDTPKKAYVELVEYPNGINATGVSRFQYTTTIRQHGNSCIVLEKQCLRLEFKKLVNPTTHDAAISKNVDILQNPNDPTRSGIRKLPSYRNDAENVDAFFGLNNDLSIDELVLRSGNQDGLFSPDLTTGVYVRDSFGRETFKAAGELMPHERPVNLFLNSMYRGIYYASERHSGDFFASYALPSTSANQFQVVRLTAEEGIDALGVECTAENKILNNSAEGTSSIAQGWTAQSGGTIAASNANGQVLRGSRSFVFASPTSTSGSVSTTFDVAPSDVNSVWEIKFDKKNLGTYVNNQILVEILGPSMQTVFSQSLNANDGLFQLSGTSEIIRAYNGTVIWSPNVAGQFTLRLANNSGSPIAASNALAFDNVVVGPSCEGRTISAWTSFFGSGLISNLNISTNAVSVANSSNLFAYADEWLDLNSLIDYVLINQFMNHKEFADGKNWIAYRRATGDKWQFQAWDMEAWGSAGVINSVSLAVTRAKFTPSSGQATGVDKLSMEPYFIHSLLMQTEQYKAHVSDRLDALFTAGTATSPGVISLAGIVQRYANVINEVGPAIPAEMIRYGREIGTWNANIANLVQQFGANRRWTLFNAYTQDALTGFLSANLAQIANSAVVYDVNDINELLFAIDTGSTLSKFNFDNSDTTIDQDDLIRFVTFYFGIFVGDANLDGFFNSSDLALVMSVGEYEDVVVNNSGWSDGDWSGDRDFTSGDLVFAFGFGGYSGS